MKSVNLTLEQIRSTFQVGAPAQALTLAPAARGQTAHATAGAADPRPLGAPAVDSPSCA